VTFEVLTWVKMAIVMFWALMPRCLVDGYSRSPETWYPVTSRPYRTNFNLAITITSIVKARNMRWAGHGGGEKCIRNVTRTNVKERGHFEDLGIDGKIILKLLISRM
jgi:hypothetical protein